MDFDTRDELGNDGTLCVWVAGSYEGDERSLETYLSFPEVVRLQKKLARMIEEVLNG